MSPMVAALLAELRADPNALRELATALAPYAALPSAPTEPDRWLDTRAAAEYLGTSPNALHKLTAARAIEFEQDAPGGKCWFQRSALDAYRCGVGR